MHSFPEEKSRTTNEKHPFGINDHKCDDFIWKTFKTEISSGKVGIKNPPLATAMWQPHQKANGAIGRKSIVGVTT